MKKKIVFVFGFGLFVFGLIFSVEAYTQLYLVSYEISENTISPDGDGVKDTTSIDIKYSEEVQSDTAKINILDSSGNNIKYLYTNNSSDVANPHTKIWDGKNNDGEVVPNGIYSVQILGIALEDSANTFSDVSKTIVVDVPAPIILSKIDITTPATKLTYNVGETLDIAGLEVTGIYSDDTKKIETITADNIIGFDSSVAIPDKVLTIIVDGKTTTYNINITEPAEESNDNNGGSNNPPTPNLIVNDNINLSDNCSITDTVGETHLFPKEDSPSKFLGICALAQIKASGTINNFDIVNYPFGLFVDSINNIKDPSSAYWALYLNDIYEMRGLTTLPLIEGDKVSLVYVDFNNVQIGPRVNIKIDKLSSTKETVTSGSVGSIGGGSVVSKKDFSVENALSFLLLQQKDDGSFADFLYTDWVGVALASINNNSISISKEKIINYLKTTPLISDIVTDNERHAIALMSLGINPYSGTDINYIKKIVDSFDGVQFGNKDLVNDDIFAIFPLIKAGYIPSDEMIQKDISFIISKQGDDGSWGSVDMTSAAIGALSLLPSSEIITKSKTQAEQYLKSAQQTDGGFENSFSTSWALQAIRALDENSLTWMKNNLNPINYLSSKQQLDGGVESYDTDKNTRIWATSYTITAVQNKSWADIMQSFPKPASDLISVVKTDIKVPKIKHIKKVENLKSLENPIPEVNIDNNLGASAGNAPINISMRNFLKTVGYTTVNTFTYIGKGFLGLINFFAK